MAAGNPTFDFVTNSVLRGLLINYAAQSRAALSDGAFLGSIVTSGAIVEGLLAWALLTREEEALRSNKAPKDDSGRTKPIIRWGLAHLLLVASELGFIGRIAEESAWAVKDFRNLVHPYNLMQQSARPDYALASSAISAVAEISRSLAGRIAHDE
jgi:hypothetical protein